jgi:iron complex transport system ATP-binding protein
MKSTHAFLRTENLSIGYKKKGVTNILFQDLHLQLEGGEMVCFMGPNGSGKSSLIKTLAGLQHALAGSVILPEKHTHLSKQIAVVLTDRVTGNLTARELITFGRYPYMDWRVQLKADDEVIIESAIDTVHVRPFVDRKISELSDGQLQMVMIARALTQDTPIILLDEPAAHLDLNNRLEVMKFLKAISRKSNKAILMSTHELDLALQFADRIWLAGNDRKISYGIPEDLILNGAFDRVFQFKGFDLRTGRVQHEIWKDETVFIRGTGHEMLWTKNALERNGFATKVVDTIEQDMAVAIEIKLEESKPRWLLQRHNRQYRLDSIADLIEHV